MKLYSFSKIFFIFQPSVMRNILGIYSETSFGTTTLVNHKSTMNYWSNVWFNKCEED